MRHSSAGALVAFAVVVGGPGLASAQRVSDAADISARGTLEVETDYSQSRGDAGLVNSSSVQLKYSLSDAVQLQLGTDNLVTVQSGASTGLVDGVYLGPKLMLTTETEDRPTIAVSAIVGLPTRDDADARTQTVDACLWGYLSKELVGLGLGLHADVNLGLDVLSVDVEPAIQVVAAAALWRELPHDLAVAAEVYTFEGGGSHADHDAGAVAELSYAPAPWVTMKAGADVALYRDVRSTTLFVGAAFVPYHPPVVSRGGQLAANQ